MLNFLAGLIWRCRVKKVMVYGYKHDQIAVRVNSCRTGSESSYRCVLALSFVNDSCVSDVNSNCTALSLMVRNPFMENRCRFIFGISGLQQTTTRNTANYRRRYGYRQPRPLPYPLSILLTVTKMPNSSLKTKAVF